MQANDDLALLVAAARDAGQIALRHWRNAPRVWDKGGGQGPVTQADLEVDRMLRDTLIAARPDHGWLSEETADTPERLESPRVFIVDPIDGTRAFIDGRPGFAHALALIEHGQPRVAVVHLPALDQTYAAARGEGAFLNGQPIRASSRAVLANAQVLAGATQLAPQHWPGGLPALERHFRPSLAWRMALVADGQFDAMITLRDAWHWDIAAGALLVAEAGGTVTDATGRALQFNTREPISQGVIAAGAGVHPALMARRTGQARSADHPAGTRP